MYLSFARQNGGFRVSSLFFDNMVTSSDFMQMSSVDFAKLLSIMFIHAAAFLSFGIISPVLAVAISLSALAHIAIVMHLTATSISHKTEQNRSSNYLEQLQSDVLLRPETMSSSLARCLSDVQAATMFVVVVSFAFLCGYIIDSLGDEESWKLLATLTVIIGAAIIVLVYGLIYTTRSSMWTPGAVSIIGNRFLRRHTPASLLAGKLPVVDSDAPVVEKSEMEMKSRIMA